MVAGLNGGEAVDDNNHGFSPMQAVDRFHDGAFHIVVQRADGLVKDQMIFL